MNKLMAQQTAVEWLYERFLFAGYAAPAEWKEQAKEMEKQQIEDAYLDGIFNGKFLDGQGYYNETYNTNEK
jgi:hypothetical protein